MPAKRSDASVKESPEVLTSAPTSSTAAPSETTVPAAGSEEAPKTETVPAVHPLARMVAGLLSTMSISEQHKAQRIITRTMYVATFGSFALALSVGAFWISAYAIIGSGVLLLLAFALNWRQLPNPAKNPKTDLALDQFVSTKDNENYYNTLNIAMGYLSDYTIEGAPKSDKAKKLKAAADAPKDGIQ
eukprot:GILI01035577.1.p1 GENE.GILI01035577.1~~GILI01035577.1.p1  ORF type:complete len:188 (-),score=39.53 GILI01035577.1:69-632(-)